MKLSLKLYVAIIYMLYLILLLFSYDTLNLMQFYLTLGLILLTTLFNADIVRDIQTNVIYLIILPFVIPGFVFLEPFYAMLFIFISINIIHFKLIWYKRLFNGAINGISIYVTSSIFHIFYPNIDQEIIFSPVFFISVISLTAVNKLLNSGFIFTVVSLEKGKVDIDAFIGILSTTKAAYLTIFLGIINIVLFYYTSFVGVAIFTFLIFFIKPALQYRQIFDNELSTYTNFVLHILKQMDPITHSHSERVKFWTVMLAKKMELPPSEIRQLSQAASWHDIGKIEVPNHILNKPDKLTPDEYEIVKQHPELGYQLVKDLHFFKKFIPVIQYHHERFDGTGYPYGRKGNEIPQHARIMAITDAFDAMTADRSYRQALSMQLAVKELLDNSGTQFDPELVKKFVEVLKEEYGERFEGFDKEFIMSVG